MPSWKSMMISLVVLSSVERPPVARAALSFARSKYERNLDLLTSVMEDDGPWQHVFKQNVNHEFDRRYYSKIYDNELLANGARVTDGSGLTTPSQVTDPVKPKKLLKNIFAKRYRIGSILDAGVQVLRKSFMCLAYKHTTHLIRVVRVGVSSFSNQEKAIKWSGKAKKAMALIVMKSGTLSITDSNLYTILAFLDIYNQGEKSNVKTKFNFMPTVEHVAQSMKNYIAQTCVNALNADSDIAKELKVTVTGDLYNTVKRQNIKKEGFKTMLKSSLDRIDEHFGSIPYADGMSEDRWNEILRFKSKKYEKKYDD